MTDTTATATTTPACKTFTKEEVAKHTEPEDTWIIISGRVYNITPFMEEHPGGDGVLMDNAGQDATSAFDDVGHSEEAQEMMRQYYIGDLDGAVRLYFLLLPC
jgi:cytochrome b5